MHLIIFDLDGVLIDACEWHRQALNDALKEVASYEIPIEEHFQTYNGLPTRSKLKILNQRNLVSKEDNQKVYESKQRRTIELINEKAAPDAEKIELLGGLKDKGCLTACCTNSISETAGLMLGRAGLLDYLNMLVTNEDVLNPKPDPEGYLKIIRHFRIALEQCLIVEDSPKGLCAAMATGANVLAVKNAQEVTLERIKEWLDENSDSHGR